MELRFFVPLVFASWRFYEYFWEPPMALFYGELALWALVRVLALSSYAQHSHRYLFYLHVAAYGMCVTATPKTWFWWLYTLSCQYLDLGLPVMQVLNETIAFDAFYRDYWATHKQHLLFLLSHEYRGYT